eukprot:7496234-Heterocapsa_arctica.AAC.1
MFFHADTCGRLGYAARQDQHVAEPRYAAGVPQAHAGHASAGRLRGRCSARVQAQAHRLFNGKMHCVALHPGHHVGGEVHDDAGQEPHDDGATEALLPMSASKQSLIS